MVGFQLNISCPAPPTFNEFHEVDGGWDLFQPARFTSIFQQCSPAGGLPGPTGADGKYLLLLVI
jgi:hypothetical protein